MTRCTMKFWLKKYRNKTVPTTKHHSLKSIYLQPLAVIQKKIPFKMNYYYSNTYWHFTGSPKNIDWSLISCPKDIKKFGKVKSDSESSEILRLILDSKTLLARSQETIDSNFISQGFCCVTDIPIQNLDDHKQYYGNIAIGFKHTKIHKEFNPVLYIPRNLVPLEEMKSNRSVQTNVFTTKKILDVLPATFSLLGGLLPEKLNDISSYIIDYFKITNFSELPEESFYREREWRKIGNFNFDKHDIAAIIVPEKMFEKTTKLLIELKYENISVLTWELLRKM
jgi:hypothetical protein